MAHLLDILIFISIWTVLAQSLNIALGYTGLLNLGHIAFFGIGAYTSALLTLAGVPFWIAFFCAAAISSLAGLLITLPAARLKNHYFAIATLGFGQIAYDAMLNWQGLTRGPFGLPGIPYASIFGFEFRGFFFVFLVMGIAIICHAVIRFIVSSPFGKTLETIREDEIGAETIGINTFAYKVQAMVVSAFFAGIAGSLFAHFITFIDPSSFKLVEAIMLVLFVVFGGMGSIRGAIIGTAILVILPEPLRFLPLPAYTVGPLRQLLYALLLIAMILYKPSGLFGKKVKSFIK